jgi:hypothetical protein
MESPAVFIPQCQSMRIPPHLAALIPPLRQRMSQDMMPPKREGDSPEDKADIKERNRLAAQTWRRKKDKRITELETANHCLRKQALNTASQLQTLKVENRILEEQLAFFQGVMAKMMGSSK